MSHLFSKLTSQARNLALEVLFKKLSVNFFVIDKDGYFIDSNERHWLLLEKMHPSLSREEMLGMHSTKIFTSSAWENSKKVIETGEEQVYEENAPLPNEDYIVYLSIKSPLLNKRNSVIGVVGISVDITEQKKTQRQLAEAKNEAEEATKAKTEFLANMSHDIRTPLIGMVGLSEYLYQNLPQGALKSIANQAKDLSHNLLEMSNALIEGAKSETGKLPIVMKAFNLRGLGESIKALLSPNAKVKNIDFNMDYDTNTADYWVGDEKRIRRIILNLTSNAIKFTEKGFVKVSIKVKPAASNQSEKVLSVVIQDTGPGIPANQQSQIFKRFAQLNPEDDEKGFGIGLSIVQQFVKDLDGTIEVESKVGNGSVFTCLLPIKAPQTKDLDGLKVKEEVAEYHKNMIFPQLQVLLVEDNKIASFSALHQLEKFHFKVDSAQSAEQAIQLYEKKQKSYDLVLTDLNLPGNNGYWLAQMIHAFEKKKSGQRLPAIIVGLSAHVDEAVEKQMIQSGMNQCMLKPLSQEKILEILKGHFSDKVNAVASHPDDVGGHPMTDFSMHSNTLDIIDLQSCARNFYSNDLKTAKKMLGFLVKELQTEEDRMKEALDKKDWEMLYHLVHNFYGGCLSCGVPRLVESVRLLKNALRKQKREHVLELYQRVIAEMHALDEQYKKEFGLADDLPL